MELIESILKQKKRRFTKMKSKFIFNDSVICIEQFKKKYIQVYFSK